MLFLAQLLIEIVEDSVEEEDTQYENISEVFSFVNRHKEEVSFEYRREKE